MPTKKILRHDGSSSSIMTLKRARRSAHAIANKSAATQPKLLASCRLATYRTSAGATPKSTKSASESSSAPKREVPFKTLAIRPSRPSSTAAAAIALTAQSIDPSIAQRIAVKPRPSANRVTRLGIKNLSGTVRSRRRRDAAASSIGVRGIGPASFTASAPVKRRRLDLGRDLGNHRLARDGARIDADHDARARRQIDVDARAEADEADALACGKKGARMSEAHDPPSDQACDLDDAEPADGRVNDDAVAFVVLARLVEVSVEEEARVIDDLGDAAFDGSPIDVAIEDRHEDRHPLQGRHAEAELGGRRGKASETDSAVGGRNDKVGSLGRDSRRIAKEIGAPQRDDEAKPAERRP